MISKLSISWLALAVSARYLCVDRDMCAVGVTCVPPSGAAQSGPSCARPGPAEPLPGPGRLGGEPGALGRHLPLCAEAAAGLGPRAPAPARHHLGQDHGAGPGELASFVVSRVTGYS